MTSFHMMESENASDLLEKYYEICLALRGMEISRKQIKSILSSYVEEFRSLSLPNLRHLSNCVFEIYTTDCYVNLIGIHTEKDWKELAHALRPLKQKERMLLSDFLSWLPPMFNYTPAEAVTALIPFIPDIEKYPAFEKIELFATFTFQREQEKILQLKSLMDFIRGDLVMSERSADFKED